MKPPGTDPAPTSAVPPQDPASRGKKRGGAPLLNTNALKHGAHLDEAKRGVRASRDSHRRKAEREALTILRAAGMENDPTAKLVARQMRRLETVAARLESYLEARGYFTKTGDPKPAVAQLVQTTDKLLGEARRLLDQLAAIKPATTGDADVVYIAEFHDGSPITAAMIATYGDGHVPEPQDEAQPHDGPTLLETAPNVTAGQPSPTEPISGALIRDRWARGLTPWGEDD